ncbi:hypothetical protein LTR06_011233 [Exophiala xenobiotica]|nr:hypothetical protein LTR06_011233 [Exophiala xenobiotica]
MPTGKAYNYLIVLTVALASFTYGFSSSIIGSVLGLPAFFTYFSLDPSSHYGSSILGAANGLFAGGGMIGCLFVARLSDKLGRVSTMRIICVIALVGAILQGAAVHIAMFLVGRTFGGMSAAMMNMVAPVYQSEVSPPTKRGKMVGLHGFMIVGGYTSAAWAGLGCYFLTGDLQWRLAACLQVVSPSLLLAGSFYIPESPRWLLMRNRGDQAFDILKKLHSSGHGSDDLLAREEYLQISQQLVLESQNHVSFWAELKKPSVRKRFMTAIFIQFIAQSTGVLVTSNYQVLLWQGLGVTKYMPLVLYGIYTLWACSLNGVASRIIDRVGRVRLLSIGLTGCVAMLTLFTALSAKYAGTSNKAGQACAVLFLYLFVTFYASCVDATSYVYCAEIFPTNLRSQGMATSIFSLFAATLLYTQPAATAFATIGWKYYLIFIIVPTLGLPLVYRLPETRGLSLEEIAGVFGDEVALDLTHMATIEKAKLDEELRIGNGVNVLDQIADHRRESIQQHEKMDQHEVSEIEKMST